MGSSTTTSPAGSVVKGKMQNRKDLTEIMVAHNLKYAAQASLSNWSDFVSKVEKALAVDGPTFINVLSPCPLGWGYDTSLSIELSRLAVETHFWPVYEYEDGKYKINIKPKQVKPLEDFLFKQARFKHLKNEPELVEEIKKSVEEKWNCLLQKESSCK
jgi:pyruvate ferredoxin oxidoreductase beta subunit